MGRGEKFFAAAPSPFQQGLQRLSQAVMVVVGGDDVGGGPQLGRAVSHGDPDARGGDHLHVVCLVPDGDHLVGAAGCVWKHGQKSAPLRGSRLEKLSDFSVPRVEVQHHGVATGRAVEAAHHPRRGRLESRAAPQRRHLHHLRRLHYHLFEYPLRLLYR